MCPPAQPSPCEIGLYWSDEQIISLIADYIPGSDLPANVLEDSSPFLYPPSNLPEGMWYLVHSNEKKESVYGFWKAKGEACNVYSNKVIDGWRTTLEYFEGLAPDGQITDWLMQEYMITPKELSDKYRPKDSILLCRVFLCSDHISGSKTSPQNIKIISESKNIDPVKSINPDTNITSDQDMGRESQVKRECEVETVPVVSDAKPNSPPEDFSELERFSRGDFLEGDFLELNDLEDPESHSSSSQNSSCPSKLSEEYFGSADFLRDLEEEVEKSYKQEQLSSSGYRCSTSIMQNDVVLQPALSGSSVRADVTETSSTSSGTDNTLTDKREQEHSTKRNTPELKTEASWNSDKNAAPSEEKKGGSSRMKKFRTYFCFAAF